MDQLDRIESKLDKVETRLDEIQVAGARHNQILDEHQRRSLALEEMVELLRAEIKPLTTHVAVIGGIAKVLAFAGTLLGVVSGALKLLGRLGH